MQYFRHSKFSVLLFLEFGTWNTRVFHLPFFFFLSSHISNTKFFQTRSSFAFTISFFYFYPAPSFNTCSRGNSIQKLYVAELDRESSIFASIFEFIRSGGIRSITRGSRKTEANFKTARGICNSKHTGLQIAVVWILHTRPLMATPDCTAARAHSQLLCAR